jgi:hypothetical protein
LTCCFDVCNGALGVRGARTPDTRRLVEQISLGALEGVFRLRGVATLVCDTGSGEGRLRLSQCIGRDRLRRRWSRERLRRNAATRFRRLQIDRLCQGQARQTGGQHHAAGAA